MNKEIKTKWIEALRSGDYKQGRTALRTHDDGYCCLGVLCDLYQKENPEARWEGTLAFVDAKGERGGAFPTDDVFKWAGINTWEIYGGESDNGDSPDLPHLNDTKGYDFKMIADVIEENL